MRSRTLNATTKISIPVKCTYGIDPPLFLWGNAIWGEYIHIRAANDTRPALEIGLLDQAPAPLELTPSSGPHVIAEHDSSLFLYPGAAQRLLTTQQNLENGSSALQSLFMYAISHSLAIQGGLALHGASFQHERFSPLILGDSRSGKSTLTSLALRMGAKVVSDDHLLLSKRDSEGKPSFELESMRADLHLRPPTQDLLPAVLAAQLKTAHFQGEQRWILPHRLNPQFQRTTNPNVIMCSKVDRNLKETEIQPMTPPDTLAELMRCSSPLFMTPRFPRERDTLMKLMLAMIHVVPAFRLRLGRDLFEKPERTFQRLTDTLS